MTHRLGGIIGGGYIQAMLLASCSVPADTRNEATNVPAQGSSPYAEYGMLACRAAANPDPGIGKGRSMLLHFPEFLAEPQPISQLTNPFGLPSQYRSEDLPLIKVFDDEYRDVAVKTMQAWRERDIQAQRLLFQRSIRLLDRWGRSSLKQKYCGSCSRFNSIRKLIAQLPAAMALRLLYETNETPKFKKMMSEYISVMRRVDNIDDPSNPNPPPDRNLSEDYPDILDADTYRALMAYNFMIGQYRSAEVLWPKFNLATLEEYGNASFPLADDTRQFVLEMERTRQRPAAIVKRQRINAAKYHVCSGLYFNYIEYLFLMKAFSYDEVRRGAIARRSAQEFLEAADPRLLNPDGRSLLERLITPNGMK